MKSQPWVDTFHGGICVHSSQQPKVILRLGGQNIIYISRTVNQKCAEARRRRLHAKIARGQMTNKQKQARSVFPIGYIKNKTKKSGM